jgi:hypothetical protein
MQYGDRMKLILVILSLIFTGCSGIQFTSNADAYFKNKVENSVRGSVVKKYTNNEVWELGAAQIGYVESDHCQVKFNDPKPDHSSLIYALKVEAQKLGGNALVFDSCLANDSTVDCNSYIKCHGMAYRVAD